MSVQVATVLLLALTFTLTGVAFAWVNSIQWPAWKPDWCAPQWEDDHVYNATDGTWNTVRVSKTGFNCPREDMPQERREEQRECAGVCKP